jgi:hypothetical protein
MYFILIFLSLNNTTPSITVTSSSVNHDTMINFVGEAFVNDTGLGTNNLGVMSIDHKFIGEIGL